MTTVEDSTIGARFQDFRLSDQALVLCRIVEGRTSGPIQPKEVAELFEALGLPIPSKVADTFQVLKTRGQLAQTSVRGRWRLTPKGKEASFRRLSQGSLNQLLAENAFTPLPALGNQLHPLLPPNLAPASIVDDVRSFVESHPFDLNVFAMTRFPEEAKTSDPVRNALREVRQVVADHSLELHAASDRILVDDLWGNVMAHIWASRYGIAILEDRAERGLNYNMTIEVGAMMTLGRRCMLLKDTSVEAVPTDLIGKIHKSVDLSDSSAVREATRTWIRDDLRLPTFSIK